ncbi:hypothetical protein AKO1_007623 [Acrasis kona]|uniref:Uncharacterized protein n=1 Tax=Acrasis kona TaxID=1008807 RepID=A0AAW2YQB8_9EUKA
MNTTEPSKEELEAIAETMGPHEYMRRLENANAPSMEESDKSDVYEAKHQENEEFVSGAIHQPSQTLLKSMEIAKHLNDE